MGPVLVGRKGGQAQHQQNYAEHYNGLFKLVSPLRRITLSPRWELSSVFFCSSGWNRTSGSFTAKLVPSRNDSADGVDPILFKANTAVVAVTAYLISQMLQPIAPHLDYAAVAEILKKAELDHYLIAHEMKKEVAEPHAQQPLLLLFAKPSTC